MFSAVSVSLRVLFLSLFLMFQICIYCSFCRPRFPRYSVTVIAQPYVFLFPPNIFSFINFFIIINLMTFTPKYVFFFKSFLFTYFTILDFSVISPFILSWLYQIILSSHHNASHNADFPSGLINCFLAIAYNFKTDRYLSL